MKKQAVFRHQDIDTLRGCALVSMIAYHGCWDAVYLCGAPWAWYGSFGAYLWQQSICWTFILLSGYCFRLGRNPVRRGLMTSLCGLVVSAVTYVVLPESPIFCGVLSFLGLATLLTVPLKKAFFAMPPRLGLAASFLLFLLTREVNNGFLGFETLRICPVPKGSSYFTAILGFPQPGFVSSDYFPILPWIFLFWTGLFLARLRPERDDLLTRPLPLLTWLGRNSLWVYMAHQPLLYALLPLFRLLIGVPS